MKNFTLISLLLLLCVLTFVSSADTKRIGSATAAVADISVTKVDTPDPVSTGANQTGTAKTTVVSPVNISGNKSVSGGTAPGSTVNYLIILSNDGASDQQDNPGDELTDVLSPDLTLVSADSSAGTATANLGTNTATWNGVIPANDSVTVTITATIKPGTTGNTINNHGTISYDANGDGTNETNVDTNTVGFVVGTPTTNADLSVNKTASADTISADSDLTYTITVNNGGPDTATSATLTDLLQGNLTFVSLSQPAGWTCAPLTPGSGGTLSCSRDLPAGSGPQVFTLVTHIPPETPDGTLYSNMASVSTTATDSNSENDTSTAGTTVGCITDQVVTSNADSGPGSLRQAIKDACTGSTISFNVTSPITLTTAELLINKDLTITGPGANVLTVMRSTAGVIPEFRIFNIQSGTVNIAGLTISNGHPADGVSGSDGDVGGGILNNTGATLNLKNVAMSANQSGTGADANLIGGHGGGGGGVFNSGTLTIVNSTLSGNQTGAGGTGKGDGGTGGDGGSGGGVFNSGTLTIVNSTLSGNQTGAGGTGGIPGGGGKGGGICNSNTLTLVNSTISGNQTGAGAGGGVSDTGGTTNVKNTIVAGNAALGSSGPDLDGTFNSQDYNLIGDTSGATINGTTTHNINNVNPNLDVLANNGGPTQTMLPLPNSAAINAGDPANLPPDTFDVDGDANTAEALPVDQRGFARLVGAKFDIGAVETNYTISATAGTPQSTTVNTAFATALKATVTESGIAKSGIAVTFTAPGSGASGTFPGPSTTATVSTDGSGVATAPTFTANAIGGSYSVIAILAAGLPTATFALTNNKLDQTINFSGPTDKTFGNPDFTVSATATSGLVVSFAASGNCTVSGTGTGTVHITAAGSCTITASQAGDATYNAAPSVPRTFNILKAATATAVSSSVNPSNVGQSVTFTATVTSTAGTPTGTVQFKDNGVNLGTAQTLNGSGVAQLTTSTLTGGIHPITADYSGDGNFNTSSGTLSGGQLVGAALMFSATTYNTTESSRSVTITVQRIGDSSLAVTVDYATPDDSSATPTILPCSTGGFVSPRCDFTTAAGTLKFAAGENSKTFDVLISQDNYVEGSESFPLTLSNPTNAVLGTPSTANVIIADDVTEPAANPIDDSTNFVRQHYHDFLNREPLPADAAGLNFWVNQIESCGSDQACRDLKRINVSGAFFLSVEFQQTGYYVYRTYKTAFGDINPPTVPVPVRYREFLTDTQEVQRGVIVGQGAWQAQIDANKQAYALAFVSRPSFLARYPGLTSASAFVDTLNGNAGNVLTPGERSALISELSSNPTDPALRADVLMKIAENGLLKQNEFNRAFVLMQYFGYLRRNPDAAPESSLDFGGFNFWLNKLNQFNGNFVTAEMVKAFITSTEYRKRFGQ
jgi:uncharacterized repeat protein (TIGR01451 family)